MEDEPAWLPALFRKQMSRSFGMGSTPTSSAKAGSCIGSRATAPPEQGRMPMKKHGRRFESSALQAITNYAKKFCSIFKI
jgi:hypothetical protein